MPIVRNGPEQVTQSSVTARQGRASANGSPKQRGRAAAATASQESQQVASTAAQRGTEVVEVASGQAREVAGVVRQQATQLTQELTEQGRSLFEETRQQLEEQAEAQTQTLAQSLYRWGSETQALVDGRPSDAGAVGEYAQQVADKLHQLASDIEQRGVDGLIDEVQSFARRRPGAFLLGAAVIGFGGGRLVRSGSGGAEADEPEPLPVRRRPTTPARRRPAMAAGGARRNPPSLGGE